MNIRNRRHRFVRQSVAFSLLVLAAVVYLAVTLMGVPPSQDANLAPQSAMVMLPDKASKAGAATATAPSVSQATAPTRDGRQP